MVWRPTWEIAMISRDRVCELLSYDPLTGVFIRLKSRANWVGKQAGKIESNGARQILLDGKVYFAHRLAWLVMTGAWPERDIDHKDGNPDNNAWLNLRLATRSQNMSNQRLKSTNSTGFKGISRVIWKGSPRWRTTVSHEHVRYVSHFKCLGHAIKHVRETRGNLHGQFVNHGAFA